MISFAPLQLDKLFLNDGGVLCLFLFAEKRPLKGLSGLIDWRLGGYLSRLIIEEFITGDPAEQVLFPQGPRLPVQHILIQGLGDRHSFGKSTFTEAVHQTWKAVSLIETCPIYLSLPGRPEQHSEVNDAITWFLDWYRQCEEKPVTYIADTQGARRIMEAEIERFRLRRSINPTSI